MTVVYDAGALVAADRNDRQFWADHRTRLELGVLPAVTAPVVAQVSRSPRQAQLRRVLRGCEIVPLTTEDAHEVGALLRRAGTSDVIDAHVMTTASRLRSPVITSDPKDLEALATHLPGQVHVLRLT